MGDVEFFHFHLDDDELQEYREAPVEVKQRMSVIDREVRDRAKADKCYYCKKSVSSFCNSHSVPKFCLRRIATAGIVLSAGKPLNIPFIDGEEGLQKAGTFRLICKKCDGRIFQKYENRDAYTNTPTGQIIAQIAMKNILQLISKRRYAIAQNRVLADIDIEHYLLVEDDTDWIANLDLAEYEHAFFHAKVGSLGKHDKYYRLLFSRILNYVVPLAAQAGITLVCDLQGHVINDIYNTDNRYRTEMIHIAILPLESTSIVMAFVDSRDKRYNSFARQLKSLALDDQLLVLLYIVIAYSENVFYSKALESLLAEHQ